jgi:hypothetical protein
MMWTIRRSRLISALHLLDLIPEKVGLSSSEFLWIRGKGSKITIAVASYIMGEVGINGDGKWEGEFFIDRRLFTPFVYASRALKNKALFEFTFHKKQLTVKHGSRSAEFQSQQDIVGYGDLKRILKEKESVVPITDDVRALLTCGQNCAVSDTMVPYLSCVYLRKGSAAIKAYAASDRVYYFGTGDPEKSKLKSSIPFPLQMIRLLTETGLKSVNWIGKYVVLKFDRGVLWQPVSEAAIEKFPLREITKNAKKSETFPVSFTASSRRMSRIMLRLGYYLQGAQRKDWVVNVRGSKGDNLLQVTTNLPGVRFKEWLPIVKHLPASLKVNWPLDSLEPVFGFLVSKTKKQGMVVRVDQKHGVSYITAGKYWLCVTSKQETN